MYFMYFIVYFAAYSVYLPPIGRRRSAKKYSVLYSVESVRTAYSFITVIPAVVDAVITSRT